MEIPFDLSTNLKEPVHRFDRAAMKWMNPARNAGVRKAIDEMGKLSAQAQSLRKPLTTFEKLLYCEDDQILYLMWKRHDTKRGTSIVIGYLKTTKRQLYLADSAGKNYVTTPVCVLDFFVHNSLQKQGFAEVIFNNMLEHERVEPVNCAYDKPSNALLEFLRKHYGLDSPITQANNFVVFPTFFTNLKAEMNGQQREKAPLSSQITTPVCFLQRSSKSESAGAIIHGDFPPEKGLIFTADSPQGRKNTRDFGHQPIW